MFMAGHSMYIRCETRARQAKSGTARPAFFDGTELVATTVILPPWLRLYQNTTIPTRSTHRGTSFEVHAALRWQKFTALTAENLKILCDALELHVPRHRHIVPGISITVLQCRSGMSRRRARNKASSSSSTWLLFRGRDGGGKTAVARELASLVFGSYTEFTALHGNSDEPTLSGKKLALKRRRSPDNDANGGDVGARLFEVMVENPHRIILIDGINRLDRDSEMLIKSVIVGVTMKGACNGDVVGLEDAIVVLSSDVCDSRSVVSASSPRVKRRFSRHNREEGDAAEMERRRPIWDLNVGAVDGEEEDDSLADDDGILNLVDGVFLFN